MSIVNANIALTLSVVESIAVDAAGFASTSKNRVTYDRGSVAKTLSPTTTPPVTVHGVGIVTLSSGSGSLDLRALTGVNGVAVDLNGLKPRAILFENPTSNANPITIAKGASNGYTGLGSSATITLQVGQSALLDMADNATAVSGTVKVLDITGTGSQVLKYQIVAGS